MSKQTTNMTSQAKSNALPDEWITRLFTRFSGMYGSKFADLWSGCDIASVKAIWAGDLGGFTGDEIKRGIDSCKTRTFPPTLPEFISLCRPPVDAESAYHHAITQLHHRRTGNPDQWKHKAIYWAAASLDGDMHQPYAMIKARWKAALDEFMAEEFLPEIPEPMIALPAPGQQTAAPEIVKAATATIKTMTGKPRNSMQHWRDIRDKHHAGAQYPNITLQHCREALANMGEQFDKLTAPA